MQTMNMKETMEKEIAEAIEAMTQANNALSRIFGVEEDEASEWETRANLGHAQQVDRFGWCVCEGTDEEGQLAEDCPRGGRE